MKICTPPKNTPDATFTKNIVIPYFQGMIYKNFMLAIYNINGNIILATDAYAKSLGYQTHDKLMGKSLHDVYSNTKYEFIASQFEESRKKIIHRKKSITQIQFVPYETSAEMMLIHHFPILDHYGFVQGTIIINKKFNVFNAAMCVNQELRPHQRNTIAQENIYKRLSNRQREILFLLTIGFSQKQVASYLGVTRGTIAKIISEQLCPIFNISGSSSRLLIKAALENKETLSCPETLISSRILEVDNKFELELHFNKLANSLTEQPHHH